jgi:hypothetical protein
VSGGFHQIVPIDTLLVPCINLVTFDDVGGGPTPGTNYDGVLTSEGVEFAERFAGQEASSSDDFDTVSGLPSNPLQLAVGAPGQNLDVFDYAGNVLAGLGPIGYSDIDAIGEGSIAIRFPVVQSMVKLSLVGGNGGSAAPRPCASIDRTARSSTKWRCRTSRSCRPDSPPTTGATPLRASSFKPRTRAASAWTTSVGMRRPRAPAA